MAHQQQAEQTLLEQGGQRERAPTRTTFNKSNNGERAGLLREPRGKRQLTVVQKVNIMLCGEEGCDWGLTCILVSFVALGIGMALLAAFGQFRYNEHALEML